MNPFMCDEFGEPFVLASHIGISEKAIVTEGLSSFEKDSHVYVSLLEGIEFLEESLDEKEHLDFFRRALDSHTRGEWNAEG